MIRAQHLVQSPHITILRLDHQSDTDHSDPEEEVCSHYAINFVEAGSFGLACDGQRWMLSPGYVLLSQPGAVHRYTHHERVPSDVCLSVIYSGGLAEAIAGEDHSGVAGLPLAIPPTNRLAFLKRQLSRLMSDDYVLGMEQLACELISAIRAGLPKLNHLYRERQLRWYADRVEAARECFKNRYAESHSLFSVAKSVGMSPFQFARVFSELTGSPPHRYLLRVRLDHARQMLLDGQAVTETCFEVGFSNLSHFTRSFRRRFGCLPSSLKSSQSGPNPIQKRKKVQASEVRRF